ncbi:hypothetical protein CB0940_05268 [Cercospora beticola]|uniref:TAP-C domain-containing protein n=1 Tax=Cercospora beticola TaxID=122368 RepID=A0A2G5HL34_CERBT|nr:hypothetical protein CB0940_05268 [Cercospora beticola]PIA93267.1 hypothetical protein CB0940_05268 [Cercospora beticola]WPB02587.1 hypothetical protein RHO25_007223 [Cercospora beticola]
MVDPRHGFTVHTFSHRTGLESTFAEQYLREHDWDFDAAIVALETEKEHKSSTHTYSSHAAHHIATASGDLKLPKSVNVRDAEISVERLMKRTGLTLEYAHMALSAREWNLWKAEAAFKSVQGALPAEAFQVTHTLSSRTGMTLAACTDCLISTQGNYSEALVAFERLRPRLPPEAFITRPTKTTFFSLPPEIRNEIYSLVVQGEAAAHTDYDGLVPIVCSPFPGLLRVNSQIRSESVGLYLCSTPFCDYFHFEDYGPDEKTRAARALFQWLDIVGNKNVRDHLGSVTIISNMVFDCVHGCSANRYGRSESIFNTWKYIGASLKIRGVQGHQIRFPGMLHSDMTLCSVEYDNRLMTRILLNAVIAVEILEKVVKLVDEKFRPPQVDALVEAGWESEEGLSRSDWQRRHPGTGLADAKKVVEQWREQVEKWLRLEKDRVEKEKAEKSSKRYS